MISHCLKSKRRRKKLAWQEWKVLEWPYKGIIKPIEKLLMWLFFPLCSSQHYASLRRYEWKWLCHLVFASRIWKTNSGRIWEARIYSVFRHFIPRPSGIWTVGAPYAAFRFLTCLHYHCASGYCCSCSPAGASQKPCASCFGPAGDEADHFPSPCNLHVHGLLEL